MKDLLAVREQLLNAHCNKEKAFEIIDNAVDELRKLERVHFEMVRDMLGGSLPIRDAITIYKQYIKKA